MSYKSPIEMYVSDFTTELLEVEKGEFAVQVSRLVSFDVNKDELIKALKYDREQYVAGYADGFFEANNIKTKYEALLGFIEKNNLLGDYICFAIQDECYRDEVKCEKYSECIDKFVENMVRGKVKINE